MRQTLNSTVQSILVQILSLILMGFGAYIYIKYRILERKIFLKSCSLFFFGLLFIVESVVFILIEASNETLNLLKGFLLTVGILIGIFLWAILIRLLRQKDELPQANISSFEDSLPDENINLENPLHSAVNNRIWVWIFTIGGLVLTAACIFIFAAYGPQHDPPGMTAEHQQLDVVISFICASVALIGLVMTGVGIRKLKRMVRPLS